MRVNVTLIPVSVRVAAGAPQFVGLRSDGAWPSTHVDENPRDAVMTLQSRLPAELQAVLAARKTSPRKVTFKEEGNTVKLIYSLALPIPMGDLDLKDAEWVPLLAPAAKYADAKQLGFHAVQPDMEHAGTLLEWWKEDLEEQAGVLGFLPQHFTARQARDIYSAIWGYEQDVESFASWSGIGPSKSDGVISPWIEAEPLSEGELLEQFVDAICNSSSNQDQSEAMRGLASVIARDASQRMIGLDPFSELDTGGLVERSALFSAAALVAYQVRARGPKPSWFRRTSASDADQKLRDLYTPRPTWAYAPAS